MAKQKKTTSSKTQPDTKKNQPDAKKKKPSAEERQKARAKQAQRENLRRTFRRIGMFALFFVVFLAVNAWFGRDTGEGPLGAQYDAVREYPVACDATAPDAPNELKQYEAPVDQGIDPESTVTALISTSCGDLTLVFDTLTSPNAVNSFVFLAREGFYDGTVIHRIRPELLIGAGDPTATGDGSAGYRLDDEPPAEDFAFEHGTVILRPGAGPNRSGSQFTIALAADAPLDRSASVLGTIVDSDEVLDLISAIPVTVLGGVTSDRSYPTEAIYIESVEITVEE